MQVATRALDRALASVNRNLGYACGVGVPHGVQLCDGPDECRKAVREQMSYGADWIKVHVDRGYFLRPDGVLDDSPTFTLDELSAIVDEAHRQKHPVAAHAVGWHGVHNAVTVESTPSNMAITSLRKIYRRWLAKASGMSPLPTRLKLSPRAAQAMATPSITNDQDTRCHFRRP